MAMARVRYCWRCRMDIPMLDEDEFARFSGVLFGNLERDLRGETALKLYCDLTGFEETNINAVHHHRLALHGPDCRAYGKPLRTPRANFCAACGAERSTGSAGAA